MDETNRHLKTCDLVPVYAVRVELADRDDARVREALTCAVGLAYGSYRGVAFESASGEQFFRPGTGSHLGDMGETITMPTRILTFSLPREPEMLARAVEAIRETHSYEEPVITVTDSWASRAHYETSRDNPNRWWNRGFDV